MVLFSPPGSPFGAEPLEAQGGGRFLPLAARCAVMDLITGHFDFKAWLFFTLLFWIVEMVREGKLWVQK